MGKRRVTRKRAPTYSEALEEVRQAAEDGALAAFDDARALTPRRKRGRPSKRSEVERGFKVFDGVLTAVAQEIIDSSRPGKEIELAHLVVDNLIAKVHELTCAGSC
jgi:hypothetical protein